MSLQPTSNYVNGLFKNNNIKKVLKTETVNETKRNAFKAIVRAFIAKEDEYKLQMNAMYFMDPRFTQKYFEVYSSYLMLMSTVDEIKRFIEANRDILLSVSNIKENLAKVNGLSFQELPYPSLGNFSSFKSDITKIFKPTTATSSPPPTPADEAFTAYVKNSGLVEFVGKPSKNQTLFEVIVSKYIKDKRVKNGLMRMIKQYNQFKHKIFSLLKMDNDKYGYGLLAYGFLFSYDNASILREGDDANIFLNKGLYNMGDTYVDVEETSKAMNTMIFHLGSEMNRWIDYFQNQNHKDITFYELLLRALEMDLCGLRFFLYYVNPKYLKFFLKEKAKIDQSYHTFLESYAMNRDSISGVGEDMPIFKNAFQNTNGLFKPFGIES